jgi:hypothetical protein
MGTVLLGIAALLVILWFMHRYVQANPTGMAWLLQRAGGVAAIVAAIFALRGGGIALALPLALMGFGLLGWMKSGVLPWWMGGANPTVRTRTAFLDLEIDRASGAMRGRVIAGRRAGADLATLDDATLDALIGEVDAESRKLLMAYRDRRRAGGGEYAERDAHARQRGATSSGKMSEEEAYQILGLQPGASTEEIGNAYRTLMKKLHPDQGGSTYLAARINEAKEVLLRRHR